MTFHLVSKDIEQREAEYINFENLAMANVWHVRLKHVSNDSSITRVQFSLS